MSAPDIAKLIKDAVGRAVSDALAHRVGSGAPPHAGGERGASASGNSRALAITSSPGGQEDIRSAEGAALATRRDIPWQANTLAASYQAGYDFRKKVQGPQGYPPAVRP